MEDERLAQIEKAKLDAINQSNNTYNQMHQDNQNMLDQNTNYAEEYERIQNENLDKQLEFYKQNIDKQKEQAQKNYETESLRAENDYVAYNNPSGYQAETFAAKGQLGSGLTRTAQIGSYNAYQNRLATANKAMNDAFTQYDLDMNEAIINNDVQKAQNALAKLEMILGFQQNFYDTKNQINQNQLSNNQNLNSEYYGRYMDMINQINSEKEREEAIRQFEAQMAYKKEQDALAMDYQRERDAIEDARWLKEYNLSKKSSSGSSGGSRSSGGSGGSYTSEPTINDSNNTTTGNGKTNPLVGTKSANGKEIKANPYTGTVNKDAKNGVFGNGYQPNNVSGKELSEYGMTVSQYYESTGNTNKSGKNIDNQKIWKYYSGNTAYLVVWDGSQNKYVQISTQPKSNFR